MATSEIYILRRSFHYNFLITGFYNFLIVFPFFLFLAPSENGWPKDKTPKKKRRKGLR